MMKQIIYAAIFFLIPFMGISQTIEVTVSGIENSKGFIEIGLYSSKEGFTEYAKRYKGISLRSSKEGVAYIFQNIPEGTYAIAVFHDENENKKIDKNWLGIPKENYGFSLNKYGTFGPPAFSEVSFSIKKGMKKTLTIKLD